MMQEGPCIYDRERETERRLPMIATEGEADDAISFVRWFLQGERSESNKRTSGNFIHPCHAFSLLRYDETWIRASK
jgi:hypothetical protein